MEKFNNTTVFTGYLKQLLHNYNLPKYKVYTREHAKYHAAALKHNTEARDNNNIPVNERPENWAEMEIWPEESLEIFQTITKYDIPQTVGNQKPVYYPDQLYYVPYIKDGKIQEYIDGE